MAKPVTSTNDSWSIGVGNTSMTSSFGTPKFVLLGFKYTVTSASVCDDSFIFPQVRSLRLSMGGQQYPQESLL